MIVKVIPVQDCELCHGSGIVEDWVDYGSSRVRMENLCSCVEEQVERDDVEIELFFEGVK